jgi:hypothetical protein
MEIETAQQKLKQMDHAEQHYFNRFVLISLLSIHETELTNTTATTIMVSTRRCWCVQFMDTCRLLPTARAQD